MEPHYSKAEWKKGSTDLLVLSLLEDQTPAISRLIEIRSAGTLRFHVARCIRCFTASKSADGFKDARWRGPSNAAAATMG